MLVRKLNERDLLIRQKKTGIDPIVDLVLSDESCLEAKYYKRGSEIRDSKLRRSYIEACLLGSNDFVKIGEILELPVELVEFYEKVFYNVSCLDRLEKLELLEGEEDALKVWAFSQGLDFIAWRLGLRPDLSPIEGLQDLFSTAMFKSKEAMFNRNSSQASIEATKWMKLAVDISRLLKVWVMDSSAAKKDLELALEKVIPDFGTLESIGFDLDLSMTEFERANSDEIDDKE